MVRNGYIPDGELGIIPGTGQKILRSLVPQTAAMRAAFAAHFGKPLVITDAYRDYDAQVRVKIAKGVYAATPGTSNHGWGRALDLGSGVNDEGSPEYRWMKANGPRFGWSHPRWAEDNIASNGQQEPWHWEASETPVPVSNYTSIGGSIPTVPTLPNLDPLTPEDDMPYTPDEIEHMVEQASARVLASNLDRLLAESLSKNLGNLGGGPSPWFKDSVKAIVAETLRENVGDIAVDNPDSWWSRAMRKLGVGATGGASIDYAALAKAVNDDAARRLAS